MSTFSKPAIAYSAHPADEISAEIVYTAYLSRKRRFCWLQTGYGTKIIITSSLFTSTLAIVNLVARPPHTVLTVIVIYSLDSWQGTLHA